MPDPLNMSLCSLSSNDPEKIRDENVLVPALSVVIAISISLVIISDELLLYKPIDSRMIPVEENGLVSISEKTSEYKNDSCIAA